MVDEFLRRNIKNLFSFAVKIEKTEILINILQKECQKFFFTFTIKRKTFLNHSQLSQVMQIAV